MGNDDKVTIKDLARMVQRGFEGVDNKFAKVDEKFAKVDERFDGLEKRFDRIEYLLESDYKRRI
ncbi:MAG: hypothetical protein HYV77_03115 [Candidatus Wildermuthbacteria bacterium]|nr:hypothetical protein [Candidatus Wildermuthbacteria bacterium]